MATSMMSASSIQLTETQSSDLFDLRSRIAGEIVTSTDPTYDAARASFLINQDRYPLAVIYCAVESDIQEAVRFVKRNNFHLTIRSGDHGISNRARIDGAVVIDVSRMRQVSIDPVAGTARVQSGATTAVIAAAAREHGLALSTGDTASVGIGGLATGGGIGFLARAYGLTIDSMISARVILATGEVVITSAIERPDLFWAIRGGGSNFGIVSEFTFRLAPVDMILGGMIAVPLTRETLRSYLDLSAAAPNELTSLVHIMHAPPLPFVPAEWIGKPILATIFCWAGDPESGQAALAPFRALAEPIVDMVAPMPYPEIYRLTEHQSLPHGDSIHMMFADSLSDTALDTMIGSITNASSPFSLIQIRAMGGAIAQIDRYETAFVHRDQRYFVAVIGLWLDPADTGAAHEAWSASTFAAIRSEGRGVYVNFLQDEGEDRIREAYGATAYERLARIKRFYDPANLFSHCQNIQPAAVD